MFEAFEFRKIFGFFPPKRYTIDFLDEKIVASTLSILEKRADVRCSAVERIKSDCSQVEESKKLLEKRILLRAAQKAYNIAEGELYRACRTAIKSGFHPVQRYEHLWENEQARKAKTATV